MPVSPLAAQPAALAGVSLPEPCVVLKLGEVVLKGGNRQRFERMLHESIRRAVADLGLVVRIWQRDGVIVLRLGAEGPAGPPAAAAADLVAERMRRVMGLAQVCRAVRVAKEPAAAVAAAVALTAGRPGSFAVRARRRDKRFPITSVQLAGEGGTQIPLDHG